MMKTMRIILALVVVLAADGVAVPQIPYRESPGTHVAVHFYSGNDLLRKSQDTDHEANYCIAYITGVVDEIGNLQASRDLRHDEMWRFRFICFPDEADAGQVRDVVV
jgi:hypothetical protein